MVYSGERAVDDTGSTFYTVMADDFEAKAVLVS